MSNQHQFEDPNEAIKAWDLDGDGQITAMEMAVAHDKQIDLEGKTTNMKKMVCVVVTLCLVVIGTMLAVTVLANELSKDSRPTQDEAVLEDLKGNIVNTQSYEEDDEELGASLLALELEDLNKLNAVQVTDVDEVDYSLNIAGFVRHSPEKLDLLTTHRIYHTVRINAGRITVVATNDDGSSRQIAMMTEEGDEEEEESTGRRLLGWSDRRRFRRRRHRCGFRGRRRRRRRRIRTPKYAKVALCHKTEGGFQKIIVSDLGNKIDAHLAHGDVFPGTGGLDSNCVSALVPIDCIHAYGEFSTCSATCGGGAQTRSVSTTPAVNGGVCSTPITSQSCALEACPAPPVDCQGSFSAYSICSVSCGGTGTMTRSFTVTTAASNGGTACPASPESAPCTTGPCAPAVCTDCNELPDTCFEGVCTHGCGPNYDSTCCFQTASGWFNDC